MDTRSDIGSFRLFYNPSEDEIKILKQNVIQNLKTLKVSDEAINKIFNTIESMCASSHVLRALNFLTQLTGKTGYDEKFYQHSDYIAEYFCTISNLGFFAVAWMYSDYATLIAGVFSALSHAVPLKILNNLDKIAAHGLFLKVISHYDVLLNNPLALASGAVALTVGGFAIGVGKKNLDKYGASPHVLWHLAAAFALYKFNQARFDVTESEVQHVYMAATQNMIPEFLQSSYNVIAEHVAHFSNIVVNQCNLQ